VGVSKWELANGRLRHYNGVIIMLSVRHYNVVLTILLFLLVPPKQRYI
jgi:hypothetical protein